MIKRRMGDILLVLVSLAIIAVIWMIQTPSEAQGEDAPETEIETDTYEVEVTEEDKIVVGDATEDATESDTEPTEPSESEEGINPPPTEEEPVEEPTEEITYWCEWLGVAISQKDYELLCRTTYCEAGGEPFKTQVMVCLVILNQYGSNKFADTIHGVVYAKNAFSVTLWKDFEERQWNEETERAVQKALAENKHPRDMFYFRTGHYHKWAEDYKKVGKVYFSTHK